MENKKRNIFLILGFVGLVILSCNKPEVYVSPGSELKCNQEIIPKPEISFKGNFIYGEPLEIRVSFIAGAQRNLSASKPYIQKPNGEILQTNKYEIIALESDDEGVYYGFYSNGYCNSAKVQISVKAKPLVIPCAYNNNWLDISGTSDLRNVTITKTTISSIGSSKQRILLFGSNPNTEIFKIEINTSTIEEGIYTLRSASNSLFPAIDVGRRAFAEFSIDGPPKRYYVNYGGGKLYVKKVTQNEYEFFICDERFSVLGIQPFFNVKTRVTVRK